MAGGAVLSLGNLSTQYVLAFVGLSVTNVMTASITVVIGTTFNYFLDDKINSAVILFPGVGCFLIAICFASGVHASNATDSEAKLPWLALMKVDHGWGSTCWAFCYRTCWAFCYRTRTCKSSKSHKSWIDIWNVSCHDIMQKIKDFSLNYPSISVVFRPKMKSEMIKRRLTNVGIPNST